MADLIHKRGTSGWWLIERRGAKRSGGGSFNGDRRSEAEVGGFVKEKLIKNDNGVNEVRTRNGSKSPKSSK